MLATASRLVLCTHDLVYNLKSVSRSAMGEAHLESCHPIFGHGNSQRLDGSTRQNLSGDEKGRHKQLTTLVICSARLKRRIEDAIS